MQRYAIGFGLVLSILACGEGGQAADLDDVGEEAILTAAKVGTDGPALLEFVRKRMTTEVSPEKIKVLIQQLGNDSYEVREKASAELVKLGPPAVPLLQPALKSPDLEVARRAANCLKKLQGGRTETLLSAALRLLAVKKPAGTADVLLALLPHAVGDSEVDEIQSALRAVALRRGEPDPALLAALSDKLAIRRGLAIEVLCWAGGYRFAPQAKRLLQDQEATVRLRAATVLAEFRDQEAVLPLIDLLVALPAKQAWLALDALRRLAGDLAPNTPLGENAPERRKCQEAWTKWWKAIDNATCLEIVRKATPSDDARARIETLMRRLGDDDFSVRDKASAELVALGIAAVTQLRLATKDPDIEVVRRAESCLNQIEKGPGKMSAASAARMLSLRKPPGAIELLMAYLPFAVEDVEVEECQDSLTALALGDSNPSMALVKGLTDKMARRRALAGVALARTSSPEKVPQLARLLEDKDPSVRLPVSLALALQRKKEAVPALIGLLSDAPPIKAWQVEELLRRLAGAEAPSLFLGTDEASARKCREAWEAWWKTHGARVDMARLDDPPRQLGYTMILMPETSTLVELGRDGKERWKVTGLSYPFDAQVLPGNRVLVAEYTGSRVTERNMKGEVLWEKQIRNPINCQRLRNGNTFIASRNQLLEVDRSGKEVLTIARNSHDVMAAQMLPTGQITVVTSGQTVERLDSTGKVLKSFNVGDFQGWGSIDVLPNGNVLVPQMGSNQVAEFNPDGQKVWEATAQMPISAVRLANGNTLVASQGLSLVQELSRSGKVVWEHKTQNRPWRARRR